MVGISEMVPEYLINAAGALAGCGPAFVSIARTEASLLCRKRRTYSEIRFATVVSYVAKIIPKMPAFWDVILCHRVSSSNGLKDHSACMFRIKQTCKSKSIYS